MNHHMNDNDSNGHNEEPNISNDIILEEGEEYEHPEQEVIGYALYLGFELPEDEDILYIAKQGLNAPVPSPWAVCQTEKGEMYFYNTVTKQSTWNHPLDDYYRKMFQEAKKARKKKTQLQETGSISEKGKTSSGPLNIRISQDLQQTDEWNPKETDSKENLSGFLESPIYANNQFDLFKMVKSPADVVLSQDMGEFKKKKHEEFLRKKKELEEIYQNKINQAKEENEKQLNSLRAETKQKLDEEKQKVGGDSSGKKKQSNTERNKKLEEFKEKMLEDLKKQKQTTLEKLRGENEAKLASLREELAKKREARINEMREELKKKQEEELKPLREKLTEVQGEVKKLKNAKEQEEKLNIEEERAFEIFKEEQERLLQIKKQELVKKYEEKAIEMKKREIEEYEKEVQNLVKQNQIKSENNKREEQERFKAELELENQKKLKSYEDELEKEIQEAKRAIADRIAEVEKRKTEEVAARLNAEYNNKMGEWLKEKAREEEKFAKERALLEQQYNSELSRYKQEYEKKVKNELEELESEKAEKVTRLNELDQAIADFSRRIGLNTSLNTKEIQTAYENKLKDLNEILSKKNQELKVLTSKKFNLLTETTSLKDKVSLLKKECEDLQEQSDCASLNSLLDHLTKKLLQKEQELQNLKQEKSVIINQSHNNISHYGLADESKFVTQPSQMDMSALSQNNDIEKIFRELESVKMVLENDLDEEEEEEVTSSKRRNPEQNRSFSHFGQPVKKSGLERKSTTSVDVPDIEKQMRGEVQELIVARNNIQNDIAQFNKEFANLEFNNEMKLYYTKIRSVMDEKLQTIEKKLQNYEKFLTWTHKIKDDDVKHSTNFERVNKTIMVDRDPNVNDYFTEDPLERMKSMVNAKRANRHSSMNNKTTIEG